MRSPRITMGRHIIIEEAPDTLDHAALREQLNDWGFDTSQFQATEFTVVDLIHPDDVITQPKSDRIAYRIVERGTSDHTIDQFSSA